ncbi:MAG: imidazole glycerol phosphate synthase subunit HisH [Clostridia bacterium]|nr:imidazole glycerol phosphate synthase subunit HisH [Clostridia bacterium]
MIAIIDYGAGNLRSVQKALEFLGAQGEITKDRQKILAADRAILPGVGAFGDAMLRLRQSGLDTAVTDFAASGKPFLGICLGLQLLFEESEESPGVKGLGIFQGKIKKIPGKEGLKIPHVGWNQLEITQPEGVLRGLGESPFVYFVHSYYMEPQNRDLIAAVTEYGIRLPVAVQKGNVAAVQFHPEKSGDTGLHILRNFIEMGEV